jgi:large subunit ribosomal protein L23
MNLYGDRKYSFIVDKSLKKTTIKFVIEKIFNVTVLKVNTCNLPVKTRRVGKFVGKRSSYKKAFVSLQEGQTISELFN